MSLDVMTWALALVLSAPQPTSEPCGADAVAVIDDVAAAAGRGDYADAARRASVGDAAVAGCAPLQLTAWAWHGWNAAAAAATRGGTPESLAPVTASIGAVAALGPPRSPAAYVAALLHAAAAAAQDERDEMQAWLDEARALSTRLALVGPAPTVPLAIDLAEGALWFGVDDYELAEAAFARALAERETPAAWSGLARARDRRGNRAGACEAYRNVAAALAGGAANPIAAEARDYLDRCRP